MHGVLREYEVCVNKKPPQFEGVLNFIKKLNFK